MIVIVNGPADGLAVSSPAFTSWPSEGEVKTAGAILERWVPRSGVWRMSKSKVFPLAILFHFLPGDYFLHHLSQLTSTSTPGPN